MAFVCGMTLSCMVSSHLGLLPARLLLLSESFPADETEAAFLFVTRAWMSADITCGMLCYPESGYKPAQVQQERMWIDLTSSWQGCQII